MCDSGDDVGKSGGGHGNSGMSKGGDFMSSDNSVVIGTCIVLMMMGCLVLIGLIKALIGMCCFPAVGMWGLGMLIDLPRPLDQYVEQDLQYLPVVYDIAGWPIHPKTNLRTVRAISRQSEFCLNLIFFLTYPLVLTIDVCTAWCFRTYDHDDPPGVCFKKVHTVSYSKGKTPNLTASICNKEHVTDHVKNQDSLHNAKRKQRSSRPPRKNKKDIYFSP